MHQYRHNKLPQSFSNKFTDIIGTDELQTRHNYYNYINTPAIKKSLEIFPYKKIITNQNSLDIVSKSIGDGDEFKLELKQNFLSTYNEVSECPPTCFSCNNA